MADDDAKWLLGDKALGIEASIRRADWPTFASKAIEHDDPTAAIDGMLRQSGGIDAMAINVHLLAVDAAAGEKATDVRRQFCHAIDHLLRCAGNQQKQCFANIRTAMGHVPITIGLPKGANRPPRIDVDTILAASKQVICVMCDNKGAALQAIAAVVADPIEREKARRVLIDEMTDSEKMQCAVGHRELETAECQLLRRANCITKRLQNGEWQTIAEAVARNVFECQTSGAREQYKCDFDEEIETEQQQKSKDGVERARGSRIVAIVLATLAIIAERA